MATDGKRKGKLNIPELRDAKLAGTANSGDCTLILTAGYQAKNVAMYGLTVVGKDYYGVFPLEGYKLLNVREASPKQLQRNPKIQNIKNILGIQDGKSYENVKELRYGHLIIMVDDLAHVGSLLKGLLINIFHYLWPSLLKLEKFMQLFIPFIVEVSDKKTNEVLSFYTISEYEAWKEKLGNKATEYKIKHKGLENFSEREVEECFADLDHHIKDFVWVDDEDGDAIELAFSKKKFEARKDWLRAPQARTYFDSKEKRIRYLDFMNKEFKEYAVADLQRSIPSMVDGLKTVQRQILFSAFKIPINKQFSQIWVSHFYSYVNEHTAYDHHYGEANLLDTVIGMAQDYVGSNNINLLKPDGQFGTRRMGGKDHGNELHLSTQLSPITRYLFHKDDELYLNYLNDDGRSIEPAWFIPIIPMVLVNGSEGRWTEFSSFIPNYNPRDIIANLKRLLNGEVMVPMHPWYKGFKGDIQKTASKDTGYTTKGIIIEDKNYLSITELPVRRWTEDYEEFLKAASKDGKDIEAYRDCYGYRGVHFEITMTEDQMNRARQEGFLNKLKLTTTLSTTNMYLVDANGELKKYDTPEQILEEFYHLRLELYKQRRSARIRELEIDLLLLENKKKFIDKVLEREIILFPSKEKDERYAELKDKGFQSSQSIAWMVHPVGRRVTKEEELRTGYDYLRSLPFPISFSYDNLKELEQERDAKNNELLELTNTSPKSLWLKYLDALICQLDAEKYPSAEKRAPAKRAPDAAGTQRANKKSHM